MNEEGSKLIRGPEEIKALSENLDRIANVKRFDSDEEPQAWTLAYTFSELEGSFRRFVEELLPELLQEEKAPEEMEAILGEIREEFRHILYHIYDAEYYAPLRELDYQEKKVN